MLKLSGGHQPSYITPGVQNELLGRSCCSVAVVCYHVSWLNSPDAEILPKFK